MLNMTTIETAKIMVESSSSDGLNLLNLPSEILEKILCFLSYEEIAHLRRVCKTFDSVCQGLLNKGFYKVDMHHGHCLRVVKSQLPRRESERRNHPLARHCDVLNAVETRVSLLSMTFLKYIDLNLCCFIPGKVIDEIYKVLRLVQSTKCPPRPHEILQELRDISSMAMEHFDEKIAPILKQTMLSSGGHINTSPTSSLNLQGLVGASCSLPNETPKSLKSEILKLQLLYKQNKSSLAMVSKDAASNGAKILQQEKKIQEQEKTILEMNTLIADQNAKIAEQEGRLNEINQKLVEYENQFSTLFVALTNRKEAWACNNKISGIANARSCSSNGSSGVYVANGACQPSQQKRKCSDSDTYDEDNATLVRHNPPRKAKVRIDYSL